MQRILEFVLLFFIFNTNCDAEYSEPLEVRLSHGGGVYGRYMTSHSGRGIKAFRGIPYAEPPIGNLRFADPVEKKRWNGYISGEQNLVICTQVDFYFLNFTVQGQEDCLYLNVYTPQNPKTEGLLPVMFYVHGGGYSTGSGILYGPDYLLDHDVVLVTGNYRLGIFGFLSTFSNELPGNYGMKDKVLMLEWVKKNIQLFGGDPQRITSFGHSSGAASISLLMTSPMSKGLIQQAILQSGNHYAHWGVIDSKIASDNGRNLFKYLNCPYSENDESTGIACLRSKSNIEIGQQILKYFQWYTEFCVPFAPVLESRDSRKPFLNEEIFELGPDPSISVMTGVTANDWSFRVSAYSSSPLLIQDLNSNFKSILPIIGNYFHKPDQKEITSKLMDFYLDNKRFNFNRDMYKLIDLLSDRYVTSGLNDFLSTRFSLSNNCNNYVYLFNYEGEASFVDLVLGNRENIPEFGVSHGDDLMYLFPLIRDFINYRLPTAMDDQFRDIFVTLWVNFAIFGKPTLNDEWHCATGFPLDYYQIGLNSLTSPNVDNRIALTMKAGLFTKRSKFWYDLNHDA